MSDWCLVAFTFALTVTAVYQYKATASQLVEMRNDERAWIKLTPIGTDKDHDAHVAEGDPVQFALRISNVGKTPAKNILVRTFVEVPPISQEVNLGCVDGKAHCLYQPMVTGTMFPNDGVTDVANSLGDEKARPITQSEWEGWSRGLNYAAVYGIVTYDDVFGVPHWTKFCFWDPGNVVMPVHAHECSRYTDTDKSAD